MELAKWESIQLLDIPWQDEQHKTLFLKLADLHSAFLAGGDSAFALETLLFLNDYSVSHFGQEEREMERIGFFDIKAHRAEHDKFRCYLKDVDAALKKGRNSDITAALIFELNEWLLNHVNLTDRVLSEQIRGFQQTEKVE